MTHTSDHRVGSLPQCCQAVHRAKASPAQQCPVALVALAVCMLCDCPHAQAQCKHLCCLDSTPQSARNHCARVKGKSAYLCAERLCMHLDIATHACDVSLGRDEEDQHCKAEHSHQQAPPHQKLKLSFVDCCHPLVVCTLHTPCRSQLVACQTYILGMQIAAFAGRQDIATTFNVLAIVATVLVICLLSCLTELQS